MAGRVREEGCWRRRSHSGGVATEGGLGLLTLIPFLHVQKTVIKPSIVKPVRTSVTACRYNSDGKMIAAGLNDGSIQLWGVTGGEKCGSGRWEQVWDNQVIIGGLHCFQCSSGLLVPHQHRPSCLLQGIVPPKHEYLSPPLVFSRQVWQLCGRGPGPASLSADA